MPRPTLTPVTVLLTVAALTVTAGCGGADPEPVAATAAPTQAPMPSGPPEPASPRLQLVARAAAAKDLRQTVTYTWRVGGRPDRQVVHTRAGDGSWRLDLPAGAMSGTVDIALVHDGDRFYQCALRGTGQDRTGCVQVEKLRRREDPRVEYVFTDWPTVLSDRNEALAVSAASALSGDGPAADGDCYAVETTAASLTIPVDAGIYCFRRDGTLTGARVGFGLLLLAAEPGPAPASITLPGPVLAGQPLPLIAPSPSPSPSSTGSPTPQG